MNNALLYARHPLQIDAVTVTGSTHSYLRDRKKRSFPNKPYAWPRVPDGTYLCAMQYTTGDDHHSNYVVNALRELRPDVALYINTRLYERLLERDAAGADIEDDVLHLEVLSWIFGQDYDAEPLRQALMTTHKRLMDEYQRTGKMTPQLPFVASSSYTFVDMLMEVGATPEDLTGRIFFGK